jgi:hypothetical protein
LILIHFKYYWSKQVAEFTKVLVQFQNLRQLELFIEGAYDHNLDYFWILDIAMASQHLQKLSLTVIYLTFSFTFYKMLYMSQSYKSKLDLI